jgi:hypothetical protein
LLPLSRWYPSLWPESSLSFNWGQELKVEVGNGGEHSPKAQYILQPYGGGDCSLVNQVV